MGWDSISSMFGSGGGGQDVAAMQSNPDLGPSPDVNQGLSQKDLGALNQAGINLEQPDTARTLYSSEKAPGGGYQLQQSNAKGTDSPSEQGSGGGGGGEMPVAQPSQIDNLFSLMASMGGTMPSMAEGGEIPPGGQAMTGEAGSPEVVTAKPQGGATVTPMVPALAPENPYKAATGGSLPSSPIFADPGVKGLIERVLVGLAGPQAVAIGQQNAAQYHQRIQGLAQIGIQNPSLLRSAPNVVAAVDAAFGAGTAQQIVSGSDPNVQSKLMAQLHGIQLFQPGTVTPEGQVAGSETSQLMDAFEKQGKGVTFTSKGELRVSQSARPTGQQDKLKATELFNMLVDGAKKAGFEDSQADQVAARRLMQVAPKMGFTVPKELQDLALANTTTDIEAARAGAKAGAEESARLPFAGQKANAQEAGRRQARMNLPISEDEIRMTNSRTAQQFGGTVFGRQLKDDDLATASQADMVLKLQSDGSFIGFPRDAMPADANVLFPDEVMAKRIAQKVANKTTGQQQNAKLVLAALDDIDHLGATSLLVPAQKAAEGAGLGGQVLAAAGTELSGQTTGRLSLFAARRSTDPAIRAKAAALIKLDTIANSVVKATGDSGNISESDRRVVFETMSRISAGKASREEGETLLQQFRQMMIELNMGALNKDRSHEILTSSTINHNQPPPGWSVVPGSGAFFKIE